MGRDGWKGKSFTSRTKLASRLDGFHGTLAYLITRARRALLDRGRRVKSVAIALAFALVRDNTTKLTMA